MQAVLAKARLSSAAELAELELECFPEDEAASLATIELRLRVAGDFFLELRGDQDELLGFVNGTCCDGDQVHHESMTTHVEGGKTLVIHSVSVSPRHRRKGLALCMLGDYVKHVTALGIDRIMLLSKANLLQLYLSAGFTVIRQSPIVHGQEVWFELGIDLVIKRSTYCPQHIIDAFTLKRFGGNPAAVVLQEADQAHAYDEVWMRLVAAENNLAETAFLVPLCTESSYSLRWFTPSVEVALCGHATLAAAHFLRSTKRVQVGQVIQFETKSSGTLTAVCSDDGDDLHQTIELNFPATVPVAVSDSQQQALINDLLLQAFPGLLTSEVLFCGRTSQEDLFVEISPMRMTALGVQADAINLSAVHALGGRGLILTCVGGKHPEGLAAGHGVRFDFISRFFAPRVGVPEDPVTGSAHCALAPYYQQRLYDAEPSRRMLGFQASKRGGEVGVWVLGDRVMLFGTCVTVIQGSLLRD